MAYSEIVLYYNSTAGFPCQDSRHPSVPSWRAAYCFTNS